MADKVVVVMNDDVVFVWMHQSANKRDHTLHVHMHLHLPQDR